MLIFYPQGYTAGDFNAQIRNQGGVKPYPRYKNEHFRNFEIFWTLKGTWLGVDNQKKRIFLY